MDYYIYEHLNPLTKELFYIGLGTGKRNIEFTSGRNKHYLNYVKKHGKPIVNIIKENLTKEEACSLEIELINKYGRKGIEPEGILLNKSKGGEGGNLGVKQSKLTKEKKSKAMKGKKIHSEKQKIKWSKERKGRKNVWDKNKTKSDKGRNKPEGFQGKGYHPLEQYSLDGKYIKTFPNMKQIKEELNIKSSSLWAHLKGLTKHSGGFIWKSIKK